MQKLWDQRQLEVQKMNQLNENRKKQREKNKTKQREELQTPKYEVSFFKNYYQRCCHCFRLFQNQPSSCFESKTFLCATCKKQIIKQ